VYISSLAEEVFKTMREIVLPLEPMERCVLEQMEELAELQVALDEAGLADVVWKVLGGVPAAYLQLNRCWIENGKQELESVATKHLHARLSSAMSDINKRCAKQPDHESLLDLFVSNEVVVESVLRELKSVRPSPDKILRTSVAQEGGRVLLLPADNAMRLVLRHQLHKPNKGLMPTLDEIRKMG